MAAKKTRPESESGGKERTPRKGRYTSEKLAEVSDRLKEQAAKIRGLAKAMEDGRVQEIEIDGHGMMLRGLRQVNKFIGHAKNALESST